MKLLTNILFATMALTGMTLAAAAPVGSATFDSVGDLPGDMLFSSMAKGMSADGSVVVGRSTGANGYEPFRWNDGTMTGLGSITGEDFQGAGHDASADGSVVVGQAFGTATGFEAFRWENGVMTGLGFPPGGDPVQSFAKGVSADGSVIVGGAGTAGGVGVVQATVWENGTITTLGDLPGGAVYSSAARVSADGSVIVGSGTTAAGSEAFRWENGTMTGLGDLPGGNEFSSAWSVSADGAVVVGYSSGANGIEAFRWENGVMQGLGDLPGGSFLSFARDASADGSVVVGYGTTADDRVAMIWTAADGMRDLKQVLETEYGLDLTGWTLGDAQAISDDGLTIAGEGNNPSGANEGWRVTLSTTPGGGGGCTGTQILCEDFEEGIPGDWAVFDNGTGTDISWVWLSNDLGNLVYSQSEDVADSGPLAENWLVTPQFAVASGQSATLSFNAAEALDFIDLGATYEVRVSTVGQTNPADFTTVAIFTEEDFPNVNDGAGSYSVDLSAYAGQSIHVAFVHVQDDGDNWYLDNVTVEVEGGGGGGTCTGAAILGEDFESGIPGDWMIFANEFTNAASTWAALNHGTLGNIARSNFNDEVPVGEVSEDYLVTPLLTLGDIACVTFDAAEQLGSDNGSSYQVLVSTTVADDAAAFTTVASYTEADFPVPSAGIGTFTIDLSAYAGQSIYIAFLHRQNNGDFFYLDNVQVVTTTSGECVGGDILCEDFEQGIPGSWDIFANEFTNASSTWAALNHGTLGNIARSNFNDEVPVGEVAEDYLATPLLILGPGGASLQFDAAEQLGSANGSEYEVLVSTTVADDPAAYTTIATYTEADFPVPSAGAGTFTVDLAAYAGQSIYIAFLHRQNNGDFFYLDNVFVTSSEPLSPPTLAKAFAPDTVEVGEQSTATITLSNTNATAATLTADLVDTFPVGLDVLSAHTTCGPFVERTAKHRGAGTSVTLQAGTVLQPNASCDIIVEVSSATPGEYTNTLAAGALQTTAGSNAEAASATLTVNALPTPPLATVTPVSLDFTVAADATADQLLNIANAAGRDPLSFSISAQSAEGQRFRLQLSDRDAKRAQAFAATHPASLSTGGNSGQSTPALWNPAVTTTGAPLAFFHDDGSYEDVIGWGNNGPPATEAMAVWINRFAPPEGTGAYTIDTISILWPGMVSNALIGMQANLLVYYDADADGDPSNAVRLGSDTLVNIAELDVFQDYPVSFSVPGDGDVYIGFADQWAAGDGYTPRLLPAAIDLTASQGMSYVSAGSEDPTDITNLGNNDNTRTIDSLGAPGNWLIRAVATLGGGGGSCTGPVVSWLSAAPTSGTVNGGANIDVTVTVDPAAGGLTAGEYQAELCITTNDPTQGLIVVPVSLTVTAPDAIFCSGFEAGEDGSCGGGGGAGNIIDSGVLDLAVPAVVDGLSIDWLSGCSSEVFPSDCANGSDWNPYDNSAALTYFWPSDHDGMCAAADGAMCDDLGSGDTIGPASNFADADPSDAVLAGGTFYMGFSFTNTDTGLTNYGYVKVTSTSPDGFPFTINQYWYDNTGAAITIP